MNWADRDKLAIELSAYLDGELDADAAREMEVLLAESEAAREMLAGLRGVSEQLGQLPRTGAPEELLAKVRSELGSHTAPAETPQRAGGWRVLHLATRWSVSVAAVVLLGAVGWWYFMRAELPYAIGPAQTPSVVDRMAAAEAVDVSGDESAFVRADEVNKGAEPLADLGVEADAELEDAPALAMGERGAGLAGLPESAARSGVEARRGRMPAAKPEGEKSRPGEPLADTVEALRSLGYLGDDNLESAEHGAPDADLDGLAGRRGGFAKAPPAMAGQPNVSVESRHMDTGEAFFGYAHRPAQTQTPAMNVVVAPRTESEYAGAWEAIRLRQAVSAIRVQAGAPILEPPRGPDVGAVARGGVVAAGEAFLAETRPAFGTYAVDVQVPSSEVGDFLIALDEQSPQQVQVAMDFRPQDLAQVQRMITPRGALAAEVIAERYEEGAPLEAVDEPATPPVPQNAYAAAEPAREPADRETGDAGVETAKPKAHKTGPATGMGLVARQRRDAKGAESRPADTVVADDARRVAARATAPEQLGQSVDEREETRERLVAAGLPPAETADESQPEVSEEGAVAELAGQFQSRFRDWRFQAGQLYDTVLGIALQAQAAAPNATATDEVVTLRITLMRPSDAAAPATQPNARE